MNLAHLTQRAAKLAIDSSPGILTSIGVVGTITTAVLAGRASFHAARVITLKEADDEVRGTLPSDPKELMKSRIDLVWQLYIPPAATGAATIACIIAANRVGARRAAGMAAAYSILERSAQEYKEKVVEKIGERKEEAIRDEIIQDRITANWDDSIEVHGKPEGEIFYDKYSDRYVWQTAEGIRSAINDLNQAILHQGYATAADLYYMLNMPAPAWSHEVGWNSDAKLMEARFSSALTPAGKPVNAFDFSVEPVRNYMRFH